MVIRAVRPDDDFTAIATIYVKSWQAAYQGLVPQDYLDSLTPERWSTALQGGARDAYVLLDEAGQYLGTASITAARDEAMSGWGELISIYFLPEYWGQGLAAPLLDIALDGLSQQGFSKVYLWVLAGNQRAKRFYEKHGFTYSGREQRFEIDGVVFVEQMYVKQG